MRQLRPQTPENTFAWCYQVNGVGKSKLPGWRKVWQTCLSLWESHTLSPPQRQLGADITLLILYLVLSKVK